ncbi:MAG: hypothetical protein JWL73_2296 [Actinomycetia bacterium]|nr:hypothetical protein [Actinomycetes bacterium]
MSITEPTDEELAEEIKPAQALALVQAQLGRRPRDGLEAAVVLEAWGGLRPSAALILGERVMGVIPDPSPEPVRPPRVQSPEPISWWAEILGLAGFVSMATWGVPLGRALPSVSVDVAFKVGVPLALALQWLVRRRYFSGERKLGSFGSDGPRFLLFCLLGLCALATTGPTGYLIAVLEVIWFAGYLLGKDGTGIIYLAGLGGTTWALYAHAPPELVLAGVATILVIAAAARVTRHNRIWNRKSERSRPVAWREVGPSTIVGGALGLMMVFSLTHLRPDGWLLAAALLPAGAASLVAAGLMRTLWFRLNTELAWAPGRMVNHAGASAVTRRLLLAGLGYYVTCVALSCLVAPVLAQSGQPLPSSIELLAGFGLFCRVVMMADFQHSWNRIGWAFVIAVPACATELAFRFVPTAGPVSLMLGATVGLLVAVWAEYAFLRRPAQILATSVSIP